MKQNNYIEKMLAVFEANGNTGQPQFVGSKHVGAVTLEQWDSAENALLTAFFQNERTVPSIVEVPLR